MPFKRRISAAVRSWRLVVALLALSGQTSGLWAAAGPTWDGGDSGVVDRSAFQNPPVDVRPGIRWWWPGGDVDDGELVRELDAISAAGFGSAEIQSFAVGLPDQAAAAV